MRTLLVVVSLGVVLAGCGDGGGGAAPVADPTVTSTGTPTPMPTSMAPSDSPRATPRVTRTPSPKPAKAPPRCEGTLKGGTITVSGNAGLSIINGAFSCAGGKLVAVERRSSSVRFFSGAKSATIRAGKSQVFAGYRIRVTAANSRQAKFTVTIP